jgi:putative nucleotidyltransferase with HDIG domain
LPSRVGSVSKALTLLGLKKLNQLIMASCVTAIMNKTVTGYDLPAGDLWRHSVAVSVAAEDLVRELGLTEAEDIFTAALLHDMGKIIMGKFVQDKLDEIKELAGTETPFEQAEQEVLGTDHAEIGAKILEKWSLPEDVVLAVRWHHQPDLAPNESVVTDVVHVANVLCLMMGVGVGIGGLQHQPSPAVVKRLGLSARQLEMVASRTLQWAQDLAESLNGESD